MLLWVLQLLPDAGVDAGPLSSSHSARVSVRALCLLFACFFSQQQSLKLHSRGGRGSSWPPVSRAWQVWLTIRILWADLSLSLALWIRRPIHSRCHLRVWQCGVTTGQCEAAISVHLDSTRHRSHLSHLGTTEPLTAAVASLCTRLQHLQFHSSASPVCTPLCACRRFSSTTFHRRPLSAAFSAASSVSLPVADVASRLQAASRCTCIRRRAPIANRNR